jgi:hypothetical protein
MKYQCQRCKVKLNSIKELDEHVEANDACPPRARQARDGFSSEVWRVLHSKKKAYPGQTEEHKWMEIYKLLFPFADSISSSCNFSFQEIDRGLTAKQPSSPVISVKALHQVHCPIYLMNQAWRNCQKASEDEYHHNSRT